MTKNRYAVLVTVVCLLAAAVSGCAQKPQSASSTDAIQQANQLETVEAQVNYLVKEANAFINSQKFDEAVNTAKYILSNLDKESVQAKSILEKAQAELKKLAEAKAEELKGSLGGMLK